jgi:hypothetical protein
MNCYFNRRRPAGNKAIPIYRTFPLLIALAAILGTAACTGLTGQSGLKDGGGNGTQSPAPTQPPPASGASSVTVSTSQVGFGNVTVGTATSQLVTVTDAGNANVTISGVTVSGSGFTVGGGTGVTLDPTGSASIYVYFGPASAGSASGTLTIASNASNSVVTLALSGTGVAAAQQQHSVGLAWIPSPSSVIGYFVYRGPSANNLAKLNSSVDPSASYTDQGVAGGQTYIYAVTSVDSSNIESTFSNEVSVTIP